MRSNIGNDGYSLGADEIMIRTFNPSPNLLTPLQVQYVNNLQWENRSRPTGAPKTININNIKDEYKK